MTRRVLLQIAVAVAAPTMLASVERPNVVFILADDLGQETIGCYGGASYGTPRLDALARAGLRFEHCYAMPVCHPTRVTLLSGRYPFRLGHPRWGTYPPGEERRTLVHALRDAGYATAIAGKWQLTLLRKDPEHPHRLGFDEYSLFGWHEGPRYYRPLIWQNGTLREDVAGRYGPDVFCDFLIDFMERHRERPFFAFYSMALCHDVTDDLERPVPFGPRGRYDSYREMVEAMDDRVGRVVDAVDRLGLAGRTLIVFTADNGTPTRSIITARDGRYIREPISSMRGSTVVPGGKGALTDGGTRVPLIARWQGVIPGGQVSGELVDCSDFLVTFAELAGATLPAGVTLDGRSFAHVLKGRPASGRRWAYAERGKTSWVRTARWKLYRDGRLFDLRDDPGVEKPIAAGASADADEEARASREKLQRALRELFGE